ncbi:MAG: YcnI family protein [Propionibacteriaceae bacterium]
MSTPVLLSPPHPPSRLRPSRRRWVRGAAGVVVAVGLSVAGAGSASAHVRVHPDSTATGSFSALTFRVPNESDAAGTVKVSVQLPQDTPFLYVSSKPVPGWTAKALEAPLPKSVDVAGTTITKAVRTVTWTAAGDASIQPGQYQEFSVSVGPLPAPGAVLLPTTQTYSDGKVVVWDQATPASGEEPERPAPVLEITAVEPASAPATPADPTTSSTAPATESAPSGPAAEPDVTARMLAGAGLLVAVAALVAAVLAWRRRSSAP